MTHLPWELLTVSAVHKEAQRAATRPRTNKNLLSTCVVSAIVYLPIYFIKISKQIFVPWNLVHLLSIYLSTYLPIYFYLTAGKVFWSAILCSWFHSFWRNLLQVSQRYVRVSDLFSHKNSLTEGWNNKQDKLYSTIHSQ